MSENFELNWDVDVLPVDESGPRVITDYGTIQLIGTKKVQLYVSGGKIAFPGLVIDGKVFEKGGMVEGHKQGGKNATAVFIAFYGRAFSDDKPFVTVRTFTSQAGIPVDADKVDGYPVISLNERQEADKAASKTVWLSDLSNLQFPALKASLTAKQREAFQKGEKLHIQADNWNTGTKPREDTQGRVNTAGEIKKYYDHYWFNIKVFADETEMLAARKEAKGAEGVAQGSNGTAHNDYPVMWKSAPAELDKYVREHFATGEAKAKIVADTSMAGEAIDGSVVDVDALLRRILDGSVPAPMLETWLVG